jgi:saccharopine dehydrogenase (NAD+, L-lysine-forming)
MEQVKIGILRETKDPPDRRVPLIPSQCRSLKAQFPWLQLVVQPSGIRCFTDQEYIQAGILLQEDLADCSILMGVKEVETGTLRDRKTYFFFSHTAKKQPYNRPLLQAAVRKRITLVDYEYLTDANRERVVAFGRWAGVVGAYNGLRALGLRKGTFDLQPAHRCHDLEELMLELRKVKTGGTRFLVTGGGRVAGGALEVLRAAGVRELTPETYLASEISEPVFARLDPWHYTQREGGAPFDFAHFVSSPEDYRNNLVPYAERTDLLIACHFWDPRSPVMLTREDLAGGQVPIRIIADISCDIDGPIASTLRASTIADPFYGYDPQSGKETIPFLDGSITVMAVDNLPGELPRDASADFGEALIRHVIPELLSSSGSEMIRRATIASGGGLTEEFSYLEDYLREKE